mmetsp:Transcript_47888/g.113807  ORF Transcript_47888/g.113807 Transcript_47888/m.113807 type:complete len:373 (+) Transcript_47888:40-1158(+)
MARCASGRNLCCKLLAILALQAFRAVAETAPSVELTQHSTQEDAVRASPAAHSFARSAQPPLSAEAFLLELEQKLIGLKQSPPEESADPGRFTAKDVMDWKDHLPSSSWSHEGKEVRFPHHLLNPHELPCAQGSHHDFDTWDKDSDGYLTRDEFDRIGAFSTSTTLQSLPFPVQHDSEAGLTPAEKLAVLCDECRHMGSVGTPEFRQRCQDAQAQCQISMPATTPPPFEGPKSLPQAENEVQKYGELETEVLQKAGAEKKAEEIVRREAEEDSEQDTQAEGVSLVVAILGLALTSLTGLVLGGAIEEIMRKKKAKKAEEQAGLTAGQEWAGDYDPASGYPAGDYDPAAAYPDQDYADPAAAQTGGGGGAGWS